MNKSFIAAAVSILGLSYGASAGAAETIARYDFGLGVHPVGQIVSTTINTVPPVTVNTVNANVVRGVNPGGRPWAIEQLRARIKDDGSIVAKGVGLVLAGGDTVGTRGGTTHVAASFFCGTQRFDSPLAELSVGGNFEIRGQLSGTPTVPCESPALLIRSANPTTGALGNWFAAGTLADQNDD